MITNLPGAPKSNPDKSSGQLSARGGNDLPLVADAALENPKQQVQEEIITGADGKLVINLPLIPQLFKPLFHAVIGQYLYEEDEFVQTVRTFGVLVIFGAAFAAAAATVFQLAMYWTQGEVLPDLIESIGLMLTTISFFSVYIRLRVLKRCTDGMVLVMMGTVAANWTLTHFCTTSYPLVWLNFSQIVLCTVLRVPYLPFFWTLHVLLSIQAVVTQAYLHTPGAFLLLFPGTRVTQGIEPIVINLLAGSPAFITMVAVWFSFEEQKRQVRVAKASSELAHKVVEHLRRYDTDQVQKIVDEARRAGEVNANLVSSFEALVGNLERYRPFLPNYLFLNTTSSDEDEEGSVCAKTSTAGSPSQSRKSDTPSECLQMSQGGLSPVPSDAPSVSTFTGEPITLNGFVTGHQEVLYSRANISYAHLELKTNDWFSLKLSNKSDRVQKRVLGIFTDTLFDIAKSSKASIHSMVGDRVQLSWNATHRVAQPEAKAATFLLKLRDVVAVGLPNLHLSGACCSGVAEIHSAFSAAIKQQGFYIDAPWLPSLEGCYHLATNHKTFIIDSNTAAGGTYDVVVRAVDCIKYRPKVALLPDGTPAMNLGLCAKNLPDVSVSFSEAPFDRSLSYVSFTSGRWGNTVAEPSDNTGGRGAVVQAVAAPLECVRKTLAFELLKMRQDRAEDEWMYQLHSDEGEGAQDPCTTTLHLALRGKFGEALQVLEQRESSSLKGSHQLLPRCEEEEPAAPPGSSSSTAAAVDHLLSNSQSLSLVQQLAKLCHDKLA